MTDTTNGTGAAARLRAHVQTLEAAIVDVPCPSGFVYRFHQPSKFGLLFHMGTLPQQASSDAIEAWRKDGIVPAGGGAESVTDNIKTALTMRDRVIALSYKPKFVIGEPANDNEISTDEVPDVDLEYLFKWVASGGDASAMLGNFPVGSQPRPLASAHRRKVRAKA